MVSHDRYFIDRVANRVLEMTNGRIKEYLGNYSDYLAKKAVEQTLAAEQAAPRSRTEPRPATTSTSAAPNRRSLQFCRRQQAELEARIARQEARKTDLEALLADPNLYTDPQRTRLATDEHQNLETNLVKSYAEWEAIAEEILGLELEAEAERERRLAKR